MAEIRRQSTRKEIRDLLFVIGAGIAGAFAFALFLLYIYNTPGSYLAKNVLLSPESTFLIKFKDTDPYTGSSSKFIFDEIQFSYHDPILGEWKRLNVSMDQYAKFYEMIGNERSIHPHDEMVDLFNQASPSVLALKIRTETNSRSQSISKPFIDVNFAKDYYRIELHEDNPSGSWAYFYHPGIDQKALHLFTSPP